MNILYTKQAVKYIQALDKPTKLRIKNGIEKLTNEPPDGDIKQMKGCSEIKYRLRIGKYRIIFEYSDENTLKICDVDSRGDIYK